MATRDGIGATTKAEMSPRFKQKYHPYRKSNEADSHHIEFLKKPSFYNILKKKKNKMPGIPSPKIKQFIKTQNKMPIIPSVKIKSRRSSPKPMESKRNSKMKTPLLFHQSTLTSLSII